MGGFNLPGTLRGGFEESSYVVVVRSFPIWPEKTLTDLVAKLDEIEPNISCPESQQDIVCV